MKMNLQYKKITNFYYFIVLIIIISAFGTDVLSAPGTLVWDNPPRQNLAGYKVYYGKSSRNYDTELDVFTPRPVSLLMIL